MKVHWTLPDYLQRSARHLASKTDLEQAMAVGKAAVRFALQGMNATMPVIRRTPDAPYRWKIEAARLEQVVNRTAGPRRGAATVRPRGGCRNTWRPGTSR